MFLIFIIEIFYKISFWKLKIIILYVIIMMFNKVLMVGCLFLFVFRIFIVFVYLLLYNLFIFLFSFRGWFGLFRLDIFGLLFFNCVLVIWFSLK